MPTTSEDSTCKKIDHVCPVNFLFYNCLLLQPVQQQLLLLLLQLLPLYCLLYTDHSVQKAVFGIPLEAHLRQSGADISVVIEQCVTALLKHGLNEEVIPATYTE